MSGQHIHSFGLKDTLLFKDVQFEIPPGLSVVYGLNRTNGRKSMQANGAGKSSAFASIGEILYEEPIVGLKEDTVKHGTRQVRLKLGKRVVDVVRKNTKLEIIVDGKPKEFRKKPDAQKWLRSHLPMSQTEFNTYGFLDARVPHPLVMGSSTERKKFFTEAFGLDKIDVERRLFEAELSKLKRTRAAYRELKAVFDADKEKALPKEKRLELEQKAKDYESELEDLNRKNLRLQTIAQLLAFEQSAAKQIERFNSLCPDLKEFEAIYKDAQANLSDDKAKLKDAREWEDYQRDSRKYHKAHDALSNDAKKLINKYGFKKAARKCSDAADKLPELTSELEACQKALDHKPEKPEKPNEGRPSESKKELRARLDSLEHRLEHALKFKTGTCDSCGQEVKVRDPKKLKSQIKEIEASLELIDLWDEYEDLKVRYKKQRAEYEKADAEISGLETRIEKAKRYRKIGRELRDLPSAPEPFEGRKLEVNVCERMVEEDRAQIELLEFIEPNLENLKQLRELTDKQRNAASIAPKLQTRITEIHEKLSKVRSRLEVNAMVCESLGKHRKRLLEMKEELVNEEPLKLLVEAYSDKSIKRMAVKAISKRLMDEVNKYAKLVFPEDYDFGFQWESSKLSLTVTRKYRVGKKLKVLTSDVRKLSGAESKLYTIILMLAHLSFVPQKKRSNVLILDEPTANFSADTTEAFRKLLPLLLKVIPSIIVITPRTDERYEGAQEFTVLKEKGEARIVKGHPKTIK
jgi:DNA repair exonuclease SbcCD ATPase subunit